MDKLRSSKILAYLLGGLISIGILVAGFSLLQNAFSRAEDQAPRDVVVSDITPSSAKISWTTTAKNQGVVEYGTSPTALNLLAPEAESATDHKVELTLLSSGSTYYFQISIGGKKYDNAGVPWTFSTKGEGGEELTATPKQRPTPISRVRIPNQVQENTCPYTDCEMIKRKLGSGCTTQDYVKCQKTISPTFAPLTTP